mgnify:CR=1 FL=1
MKRILLLFPLVLIIAVVGGIWWKSVSGPLNPKDTAPQDFLVSRGQSLTRVAQNLEKQKLVKSATAFRFYTQLSGQAGKIQPGEYSISPSFSMDKIMMTLISGPKELWVTYPEGLRLEEMAAKTIKTLGMTGEKAQTFWTEFMGAAYGKEGYLFPETYLFPKDVKGTTVANKLLNTFETKVTKEMRADSEKSALTFVQLITLASIVERETLTDKERPIVAGILMKRLDAGWPLQADATLQYATGTNRCGKDLTKPVLDCDWWVIPEVEDRQVKSSYNSYTNKTLPPGPNANPSLSSIRAVIYPEDSDYWFYIHDTDGKIRYAKDADEHANNVNKYLR